MALVNVTIDKTIVQYEEIFTYGINVSLNSLTQAPGNAITITCFVPSILEFHYHAPDYPIQSVTTEQVLGGTNITYTLEDQTESGVSIFFDIYANFPAIPTVNVGAQALISITVLEGGQSTIATNIPIVTLRAVPNYITQTDLVLVLPNSTGGPAGELFVLDYIINNSGDSYGPSKSLSFTLTLPTGLALDTNYLITGTDISNNAFADDTANFTTQATNPTSFTYTLSSYRGSTFRVRMKGAIATGLIAGAQLTPVLSYSYYLMDDTHIIPPSPLTIAFHIQEPVESAISIITVPQYASLGAKLSANFTISNTGNTSVTNLKFHLNDVASTTTDNITVLSMQTGIMTIPALNETVSVNYTIKIETVTGTVLATIPCNTSISSTIPLPAAEPGVYVITTLSFESPIPVGALFEDALTTTIIIPLTATVPSFNTLYTTLWWNTLTPIEPNVFQNNPPSLQIGEVSVLQMSMTETSPNTSVIPGDIIEYQAFITCDYSPLNQPAFAMILDPALEYIFELPDGRPNYIYTDIFDPDTSNIPRPIPIATPNYQGSTDTILTISYTGSDYYIFNQKATITIPLRFRVKVGSRGLINQFMLLGTYTSQFVVADGYDTYNAIQPDQSLVAILKTNTITNRIDVSMSISSNFRVASTITGPYVEYPDVATAYEGDTVYYQINISNTGSAIIDTIEIVNIMPHVNDTGVILTSSLRESQYPIYLVSWIDAVLPVGWSNKTTIYYSQSYDPVRFGPNLNETIGTDPNWVTLSSLSDTTSVRAYKIVCSHVQFLPNETLTLNYLATIPSNVSPNQTAWDSFAAKITYFNDEGAIVYAMPVEPEKSGVQILASPVDKVTIGGFVWNDLDKTGVYVPGEPGINDVAVLLYSENEQYLQTVFTSPDIQGNDGYYSFNNIDAGNYYVRFVPNWREWALTKQMLDTPNGSLANPITGFTPLIDMTTVLIRTDIITGLVSASAFNLIMQINKQANQTLRNCIYSNILLETKLVETIDFSNLPK